MHKMETALNDWLGKVEDQVNQIEASVATKVTDSQLRSMEQRILAVVQQNQPAEMDTEDLKARMFLLEKKYTHL